MAASWQGLGFWGSGGECGGGGGEGGGGGNAGSCSGVMRYDAIREETREWDGNETVACRHFS
jgi:hypothetical protein